MTHTPARLVRHLVRQTARRLAAPLALLALAACHDDPAGLRDLSAPARLSIAASASAAGQALRVQVSYLHYEGESQQSVPLLDRTFSLGSAQTEVPVSVSLTTCLADPTRERTGTNERECVLHVSLALLDAAGQLVDRTQLDPIPAAPGAVVSAPAVALGLRTAFAQFAENGYVSCGTLTGGATYCAGNNSVGQLGIGTVSDLQSTFVLVQGGPFAAVPRGAFLTTCGLRTGGIAYCWGDNSEGQLGVPVTSVSCAGGTSTTCASTPVAVSGGLTLTSISPGFTVTCGVATGGRGYCWGTNAVGGELGGGPRQQYGATFTTPQPVAGQQLFSDIATGIYHSCGLGTDGKAYCWGRNDVGELGVPSDTSKSCLKALTGYPSFYDCRDVPTPVSGNLTFASVGVGDQYSCGLTTAGAAWCWGVNTDGQLGIGTTDGQPHGAPVAVSGGHTFTQLSVGEYGACGVTAAGALFCWGTGLPSRTGADLTRPTQVDVAHAFTRTSVGSGDVCAMDARGGVFCFGYNGFGELGLGNTNYVPDPTPVGLPVPPPDDRAAGGARPARSLGSR